MTVFVNKRNFNLNPFINHNAIRTYKFNLKNDDKSLLKLSNCMKLDKTINYVLVIVPEGM